VWFALCEEEREQGRLSLHHFVASLQMFEEKSEKAKPKGFILPFSLLFFPSLNLTKPRSTLQGQWTSSHSLRAL
jgi:hypothetical protein